MVTLIYNSLLPVMCFNDKVSRFAHRIVAKCRGRRPFSEVLEEQRPLLTDKLKNGAATTQVEILESDLTLKDIDELGKIMIQLTSNVILLKFV